MKRLLVSVFMSLVVSSALASELVIDIHVIAGKSKQEVASALGKPSSCTASKYGSKYSYDKGQTEIVFIGGKADWITVEALDGISYDPAAITAFGLKATTPTFNNQFTVRWERVQGLREVSIFPIGAKVDYAYIKVVTE